MSLQDHGLFRDISTDGGVGVKVGVVAWWFSPALTKLHCAASSPVVHLSVWTEMCAEHSLNKTKKHKIMHSSNILRLLGFFLSSAFSPNGVWIACRRLKSFQVLTEQCYRFSCHLMQFATGFSHHFVCKYYGEKDGSNHTHLNLNPTLTFSSNNLYTTLTTFVIVAMMMTALAMMMKVTWLCPFLHVLNS